MKLVRLAIIALTPVPKENPPACIIQSPGVDVEVTHVTESSGHGGQTQFIAKAITEFSTPALDSERFIVIPDELRRQCEFAIMRAADLFAIATRRRRQIISATPPAALIPESDSDRALIAEAEAIRADAPRPLTTFHAELNLTEVVEFLSNRWDGVAMLAEAYSHTLMSGRYRDLVRLFELAFGRSFMQMEKKLNQALLPAMGYTIAEIRKWQRLRHPFSHADGEKTNEIAFEADAWPVVQRMEQAALDILFNKAEWRAWSSSRRNVWTPKAITASESGKGLVEQGSKPSMEFLLLDEFGIFPRVIQLQHTNLPREWWYRFVPLNRESGRSVPLIAPDAHAETS